MTAKESLREAIKQTDGRILHDKQILLAYMADIFPRDRTQQRLMRLIIEDDQLYALYEVPSCAREECVDSLSHLLSTSEHASLKECFDFWLDMFPPTKARLFNMEYLTEVGDSIWNDFLDDCGERLIRDEEGHYHLI